MKTRHVVASTLLSLLVIAGVGACRHGHHRGGFDEFDIEAVTNRIASRLDLSEAQKTELTTMVSDIASKAKEMRADHETRHRDLADLVRQDTIDQENVDLMISAKLDQMRSLADYAAGKLIAFHAELTPEQREKIATHIEDHAAGRGCFFKQ